jgi:signal transduction histidine kinase
MDRELDVCGKIIGDLLDFARERPPSRSSCPIRALAEEAIGVVQGKPHVRLVNEVPGDLPIAWIDKDQFRQVLVNLIQNAVESVPPERTGTVRVRATGGGASAMRIEVADDGMGMPKDVADKIFQPLFTTKTKGTGLGLAIVANIVNRHGGAVSVESEVGSGTRFLVELPPEAAVQAA